MEGCQTDRLVRSWSVARVATQHAARKLVRHTNRKNKLLKSLSREEKLLKALKNKFYNANRKIVCNGKELQDFQEIQRCLKEGSQKISQLKAEAFSKEAACSTLNICRFVIPTMSNALTC